MTASHSPSHRGRAAATVRPAALPALLAALAALASLSAGCAKGGKTATFGSSKELLAYGEYTSQTPDPSGHLVKLKLNQGHTYIKKKFQGPCLLLENKGEWESTHDVIEFRLKEVRHRPDCQTEAWTTEAADKVVERNIRNVTPKSFELLDQDEQSSAEWLKFVKP